MNREQRRSMANGSKKADGALKYLESPCSITEAVQIARGVAEDVVADYNQQTRPLNVSISLQMEIMKSVLISSGLITEDEFKARYIAMAEDFNKRQEEMIAKDTEEEETEEDTPQTPYNPTMSATAGDVEIKTFQE